VRQCLKLFYPENLNDYSAKANSYLTLSISHCTEYQSCDNKRMFDMFKRNKEKEVWVNISSRTILRVIIMVAASILLWIILRRTSHALILIFTAFFLALALNAPVHWLAQAIPGKKRGSRALATTISTVIVFILLASFFASIIPPLARQTNDFISAIPHIIREVHDKNSNFGKVITHYHLTSQVNNLGGELKSRLHTIASSAVSTIGHLTTSVFSVVAILVLTFMMLVEGPRWTQKINQELIPNQYQEHLSRLANEMYKVIKGYVNGQVVLAALAALLITPALFILHIGYPLALAVLIFIFGLIPMVGHTLGAIVISIVALFHSPIAAIIILVYYLFYQQVENYVIQPRIQANTTDLSPLLVFMAIVIGISFDGLFGGLIAIPIAGCLRVLIIDYLETKHLVHNETINSTK
jgi:predicted PurR-regulated permease PerM